MDDKQTDGWHVGREGESYGPYRWDDLVSWGREGRLGPDDLVWQAQMSGWVPAREVEGLFPDVPPAAAPPLPPPSPPPPLPFPSKTAPHPSDAAAAAPPPAYAVAQKPSQRGRWTILGVVGLVVAAGVVVGALYGAGVIGGEDSDAQTGTVASGDSATGDHSATGGGSAGGAETTTGGSGSTTDNGSATTTGGASGDVGPSGDDVVLPPGFPEGMPLPAGTVEVVDQSHLEGYEAFYSAYVTGRHFADVIPELEAALPAAGWSIVDQKADLAWVGDRQFTVESSGIRWDVYVGLKRGTDHDTHVAYTQRE